MVLQNADTLTQHYPVSPLRTLEHENLKSCKVFKNSKQSRNMISHTSNTVLTLTYKKLHVSVNVKMSS
jgi:hypothetical protein